MDLFTVSEEEQALQTCGIKSVWINNFKNIKSKHYQLDGRNLLLQGKNGLGKTNVLGAIYWCISGKDFDGTSKYDKQEVMPKDSEKDTEVSVKIELMNGVTFERKMKEKYSKEGDFKGNDVTLLLNGAVEKNQKTAIVGIQRYLGIYDLQTRFNENPLLSSIDVFELLWNANTLKNMDYKQLRAIVIDMVGEVDFKDIINENEAKYGVLVAPLKAHGLDLDALKSSTRNAIFDKPNGLEARKLILEGVTKELEAKSNQVIDEALLAEAKSKVSEIDAKISDKRLELQKGSSDATRDLDIQINDLRLKIHDRQDVLKEEHAKEIAKLKDTKIDDDIHAKREVYNEIRSKRFNANNEVTNLGNQKYDVEQSKARKERAIENNNDELTKLGERFENLQNPETEQEAITCPHCNQTFTMRDTASYQEHLNAQLDAIELEGQSLNEKNEVLQEGIQELELEIEGFNKKILQQQNKRDQFDEQLKSLEKDIQGLETKKRENNAKLPILDIASDSVIIDLNEQISGLNDKKQAIANDLEAHKQTIKGEIFDLEEQKKQYSETLGQEQVIASYKKSAQEKRNEYDLVNKELIAKNEILTLIKELEKDMYSKLDAKVSGVFGENIAFQLYKLNVTNGEYDTRMCELYVRDSHGTMVNIKRINTGLSPIRTTEVIHKIKEFYGIPHSFIFVDEVASLDSEHKKLLLAYGEQVFATAVSESNKIEEKEI